MRRFHEAKVEERPEVVVWGTGTPLREFLHVDDLAQGVVYCLDNYDEYTHINCGAGSEISIKDLATLVARVVGYNGRITFDASKPDGTPRKLMDSSRLIALGWKPEISLESGIQQTYDWFLKHAPAPAPMVLATT
jgi:GDP-L-fucose synthase